MGGHPPFTARPGEFAQFPQALCQSASENLGRYYELALRAGIRRALMLLFQQEQFTDWDRIKAISIPTLILWGRLDPQVPLSDAERFHKDIAGSQLVVFDGLGHVPHEEDPSISVKALEAFLTP